MKNLLLIICGILLSVDASAGWIQRASLGSIGRHRLSCVGVGNFGYAGIGHVNGTGVETYYSDWWQFNPGTNVWTQKADFPGNFGNGELGCHAWEFNNYAYVGLGELQKRALYRYDPETNSWQQMTNAPAGINFQDTQDMVIGDKAYFTDLVGDDLYVYNCTSDTWTFLGPLPMNWSFTYSAFTYNNLCYVKVNNAMWMYNPVTNSWSSLGVASAFPGFARKASAEFFVNDKFYVIGGHSFSTSDITDEVWEFDPTTLTWDSLPPFSGTSRRYTKAMVINGKGYVCGGTNGTNFNDFWEFDKYLSTDELPEAIDLNIYPNPATDLVHISCSSSYDKVRIINQLGKVINEAHSEIINISDLPGGSYQIQMIGTDKEIVGTKPLIIQ